MPQFRGLADKKAPPRILWAAMLKNNGRAPGLLLCLRGISLNIGAIKEGGCTSDQTKSCKKRWN
jgi:hypothetical protein